MKFGAVFPTNEIGSDPVAIRRWAEAVDRIGYTRIAAYDHVVSAVRADREPPLWGPYDETYDFHEPLTLLSYLAGITNTVELATGILILPQRQTVLAAKQVAQIDLLSGGRAVLGVSVGYNRVEYESLGVAWEGRGGRLDEQIEVLRSLWSEHPVDLKTPQHRVDRAGISPLPQRRIPIWIGGFSDAARRRAARTGDGFMIAPGPSTAVREQVQSLRQHLAAQGRDPASFPIEVCAMWAEGRRSVAETLEVAAELQVSHVTISTMHRTSEWLGMKDLVVSATAAEHICALEQFWSEFATKYQ